VSRSTEVGLRGQFNDDIKGATPLYAINEGLRRDENHRDTLAKIFMRVDPGERDTFLRSIGDSFVQERLAPQVTGLRALSVAEPAPSGDAGQREQRSNASTGYVDFFLQSAVHVLRENYQVAPTLEGNYVVYSFDQEPPVFPYSGLLLNTRQDDQATNFYRLYVHILRLAQVAKRQKVVALRYGAYIVQGAMVNIQLGHSSELQNKVDFSFQLLVREIRIIHYEQNWKPTVPASDFSDDPNAAGPARTAARERTTTAVTATTPVNAELSAVPAPVDPRTVSSPPTASPEPIVNPAPTPAATPATVPASVRVNARPETVNRPAATPRRSGAHT
jgi:hypothetical protein